MEANSSKFCLNNNNNNNNQDDIYSAVYKYTAPATCESSLWNHLDNSRSAPGSRQLVR